MQGDSKKKKDCGSEIYCTCSPIIQENIQKIWNDFSVLEIYVVLPVFYLCLLAGTPMCYLWFYSLPLSQLQEITKWQMQLLGVTAMLIACKYEEIYYPTLADFVYITAETYTKEDIKDMEMEVLRALDYSLGSPASLHFLRRYSRMAEVRKCVCVCVYMHVCACIS